MTDKIYTIEELREIITPIAIRHNVDKVYLFGSYARGEANADSDVDLRVDAAQLRGLFALGGLYTDLEDALQKSLDLVTTESLQFHMQKQQTKRFWNTIHGEEVMLYAGN